MNHLDVIIAKEAEELPRDPVPYWAATAKGWIINIPTLFGVAQIITPETPSVLPEVPELFCYNGKKLPVHLIRQAHDFFRQVWEAKKSEASAFFTHNPKTDDFKLFIPEQYASMGGVKHKLDPGQISGGYHSIGTIHSHCNFNAYHSSIDTHDMSKLPGIHVTLGHVDTDEPSVAIALSVRDTRFDPIAWDKIIDEERAFDANGYDTAPAHWMRFVKDGQAPWTKIEPRAGRGHYKPPYTAAAPNRPSNWQSFSDDNDWTNYRQNHTPTNGVTDNDGKVNAFVEYQAETDAASEMMNEICEEMAALGFDINWSMAYNPKKAAKWLKAHGVAAKQLTLLPAATRP